LRSHSTHQFDLRSVLELAAALNRLPHRIVLWAIPIGGNDTPQGTLGWSSSEASAEHLAALPNATLERHICLAVQRIANEIDHARTIARYSSMRADNGRGRTCCRRADSSSQGSHRSPLRRRSHACTIRCGTSANRVWLGTVRLTD